MATESIWIDGQLVETLVELLRPGLRAVFVGVNPAPRSVEAGHFWQGSHGKTLWRRLQDYGIAEELPSGREDEAAFDQGFGFADLVRRPASSADELAQDELEAGVDDLIARLARAGDRPKIIFVYKRAWELAAPALERAGYTVLLMPPPYASKETEREIMTELRSALRRQWSV